MPDFELSLDTARCAARRVCVRELFIFLNVGGISKQKFIAVKGNNDIHIATLNEVEVLELPGGNIVIEHGHMHGHFEPSHESLREAYPEAKAIIYGHTHKQVIDNKEMPWVINPGSAGQIRNYGAARCLTLTIEDQDEWTIQPHIYDDIFP